MAEEAVSKNFIEQEIEKDLAEGVYDHVCTRFPPEPNGYLHIGHAKSILLNYGLAQKYNGTFHMRFDDTNPTKEKTEFVESIKADIKWLGADWGDHLYFASDYFDQMYEYAIKLINENGKKMDEETISLATLRAYLWYAADMDIFLQSIALSASHVPFIKEAKKNRSFRIKI